MVVELAPAAEATTGRRESGRSGLRASAAGAAATGAAETCGVAVTIRTGGGVIAAVVSTLRWPSEG